MGSEKLEKARKYEAEHEANMTDVQRPGFHLSVQVGWMNDPNDSPTTTDSIICSISITRIPLTGVRCTGDLRSAKTCCTGSIFR